MISDPLGALANNCAVLQPMLDRAQRQLSIDDAMPPAFQPPSTSPHIHPTMEAIMVQLGVPRLPFQPETLRELVYTGNGITRLPLPLVDLVLVEVVHGSDTAPRTPPRPR
jgi:hypothetical protein